MQMKMPPMPRIVRSPSLAALLLFGCVCASLAAPPGTPLAFERNDSIEVLRAKIAHNGCSFKVGHNWVYDLPPEHREAMRGRRASSFATAISDEIGPLEKHLSKALPAAFDWRNFNGHFYIGPVRNQGSCGSCYAFGAAAAAEGTYNFALGLYDGACADFSEAFIAGCVGSLPAYNPHFYGCDGADYDYQELQALTVEGICYESAYPYSSAAAQTCPSTTWSAPRAVFASWYRVPCGDIEAIKTAIMTYGVVDVAVQTTSAWDAYAGGIYSDSNTACTASPCYNETADHAVSLVGWDDTPPEGGGGCWTLRNSWGPDWGEGGYMRIRYTSAAVSCAVCYLVYGGGAVSTPTPTTTPVSPPAPTPVPPLALIMNASSVSGGSPLIVDAMVQMLWQTVDFWGVVFGPGGTVYSFVPGNPAALRPGAAPLDTDVPGFWAPVRSRLLEMTIPPGAQGDYRIVAGLVPAGIAPTGPESAVPGYVDQKTIIVR